jgi:hypothetical protein
MEEITKLVSCVEAGTIDILQIIVKGNRLTSAMRHELVRIGLDRGQMAAVGPLVCYTDCVDKSASGFLAAE